MKIKIKVRTTSAEIVASIDDLLTQILLRLPIKLLIQLKLVSKRWHSLITDPCFPRLRNPSPNPASGIFVHHSNFGPSPYFQYISFSPDKLTTPPFRKLDFTQDPSGIGILQSCNGLLLCSSFQPRNYTPRYYVYNPTTRRFTRLPKLSLPCTRTQGMSLAFDPAKSPHYKVARIRKMKPGSEDGSYQMEVYSSEAGPWRKRGGPFTARSVNFARGVYWNGAIHWISNGAGGDSLYLNLDESTNHMPQILPMPPLPVAWDWRNNYYFGESCDHLHYIEFLGGQDKFSVYEMKRDYSEWFVKYSVDLSPLVAAYPAMIRGLYDPTDWYYYAFSIFTVVRGEKSFLVLQIPGKVVSYDLDYGTFQTVHEYEEAEDEVSSSELRYPTTNAFQYIESLSCV